MVMYSKSLKYISANLPIFIFHDDLFFMLELNFKILQCVD
jgi:hypothetical protein